jgi:hypothetical protein
LSAAPSSARGLVTLANDAVVEDLVVLLESVTSHEPALPVTVIPFDEDVSMVADVVSSRGHTMYAGPLLEVMDEVGRRYWPGETMLPRNMRKFCAFWSSYETFFFLDADSALLGPIEPYFDAFDASDADFLYFHPDVENCYRPGRFRDVLVRRYGSVGFNGGAFLSRHRALEVEAVRARVDSAAPARARGDFVDNLEQTFLNYCVDCEGLRKLSWADAVPGLTAASALMLMRRRGGVMVLEDARTPDSGRPVAFLHWAGYRTGPFMPYRRIFRRYRLGPEAPLGSVVAYEARSLGRSLRRVRPRVVYSAAHKLRFQVINWLAARGLISWPR